MQYCRRGGQWGILTIFSNIHTKKREGNILILSKETLQINVCTYNMVSLTASKFGDMLFEQISKLVNLKKTQEIITNTAVCPKIIARSTLALTNYGSWNKSGIHCASSNYLSHDVISINFKSKIILITFNC